MAFTMGSSPISLLRRKKGVDIRIMVFKTENDLKVFLESLEEDIYSVDCSLFHKNGSSFFKGKAEILETGCYIRNPPEWFIDSGVYYMENIKFIKNSSDEEFGNFFKSLCDLDNTNYGYLTDSSEKLKEEGTCILFLLSENLYMSVREKAIKLHIPNPFMPEREWHLISSYLCPEDDHGWDLINSGNGSELSFVHRNPRS